LCFPAELDDKPIEKRARRDGGDGLQRTDSEIYYDAPTEPIREKVVMTPRIVREVFEVDDEVVK
jgi:hypothetical protein